MTAKAKAERLFGAGPAIGVWLDLPSPEAAEIAAVAGPDWALIDLEHGAISIETAGRMAMALRGRGVTALARPPEANAAWIKRLLDLGAAGLVLPMIDDAATAAAAVEAALYPPRGRRGMAPAIAAAASYGAEAESYAAGWNDRAFLAMQIESARGLEAAGEIAAVEGVDMLFFGPADYAADIGARPDDPALREGFRGVAAAARAAGLLCGAFATPAMPAAELIADGADLVAVDGDIGALGRGIAASLAAARGTAR